MDPETISVDPFSTDDVATKADCLQAMHFVPLVVLVLEEVMVAEHVLTRRVPDSTFEEALVRRPTDLASETVAVANPVDTDHFQNSSLSALRNFASRLVCRRATELGIRRSSCFQALGFRPVGPMEEIVGTFLVGHSAKAPDCHTPPVVDRAATCYCSLTENETVAVHRPLRCTVLAETVVARRFLPASNFRLEADHQSLRSFDVCSMLELPLPFHDSSTPL